MLKLLFLLLSLCTVVLAADLPSKKYLNLAAIKTMVAASEAKAQELHVEVTICIVDESGNLLFLQKGDTASLNTIQWAQKKARHAAFYKSPSKDAEDAVKKGNMAALEAGDLDSEVGSAFAKLGGVNGGLLNEEDLEAAAEELEPNSSAALLVWEDVWATKLRDAIVNAGGELLDLERLPGDVVQAAVEWAESNA